MSIKGLVVLVDLLAVTSLNVNFDMDVFQVYTSIYHEFLGRDSFN